VRKKIAVAQVSFIGVLLISFLIPCYKLNLFGHCETKAFLGYQCFLNSFFIGVQSFKENLAGLLILPSALWIPVILLIKKRKVLLYVVAVYAILSVSFYWLYELTNGTLNHLLMGYWIWYGSSLSIIALQIFKVSLPSG